MTFITTLTAAAISMCAGLCAPLEKVPFYKTDGMVGLVEHYFINPKSPLVIVHPEFRFAFARECFRVGNVAWCESHRLEEGRLWPLWKNIEDREGDCVLVATSSAPEFFIEHYVCRDIGIS